MKKILYLIISLNFLICNSQITKSKIVKIADKKNNNIEYDSLTNYLEANVYRYIGQSLYLKKLSQKRRYQEYFVLKNDVDFYDSSNKEYNCKIKISTDRCKTNFDNLEHKYFNVFGVWKHPNWEKYPNEGRYYLGLINNETKDSCYYLFETKHRITEFPFIVSGFFEKQKKKFVNRKYIVNGDGFTRFINDYIEIKTGEEIKIVPGEEWECIDLTLDDESDESLLIMKNKLGKEIGVKYSIDDQSYDFLNSFIEKNKAEKIKKTYGINTWNNILKGKVQIGWTKEMCILSWGEPNDKNRTITKNKSTEQWVYSGNYLYFDGNKLTSIQ